MRAATIPTAAAKPTNNAIMIAMIATKISVIEVPLCYAGATLIGLEENHGPYWRYRNHSKG